MIKLKDRGLLMDIIFAGSSHLGLGGYMSLWKYFDKIYLIKDTPDNILNSKRMQDEVIDDFDSVDVKYIFLCGYIKFIEKERLDKKVYINIHGALLPKYRGMHATFYAIMNGEEKLGITFHIVDQYMDTGDIIAQFSFPYEGQSVHEINNTIDELVYQHSGKVLSDFLSGTITPVPQNEDEATFGAKRNLRDCLIDFTLSNQLLRRFFKALTPDYPYPMLSIRGELYEVLPGYEIIDREYYGPVGRAVFINERGVWIKVQEGFLIVSNIRKYGTENIENLSELIPIGYRFMQLGGADRDDLIELDNVMMRCIQENENFMPDRWKKFIALFYPDAHIRKKYLKYLNIYMEDGTYSNLGIRTQ